MYYDLHVHSTNSDGVLDPFELVKKANELGLEYLCITDHDFITETQDVNNFDTIYKIILLPGIEFSIEKYDHLHILGYGIGDIKMVKTYLKKKQLENLLICKRLLEHLKDDYKFDLDLDKYKNCNMSKALIRRMLVETGYASSLSEAGDLYTGKMSKYYEPTAKFPLEDTINIILKSGGIPVLAHPCTLKFSEDELDSFMAYLKGIGVMGIEITNLSKNSGMQTGYYESLAKKYDLLTTCGIDLHKNSDLFGIENEKSKKLINKIMR